MDRSEVEKISKALADKTRVRIVEAISATKRMNCGEIVSMRGVTPATVSHHLKVLSAPTSSSAATKDSSCTTRPFLEPSQPTLARSRKSQEA
jgi:DNA-binding transcriptional ArsR family regulator